jgi:predicted aldo/keto reductase-like oxidoreductase
MERNDLVGKNRIITMVRNTFHEAPIVTEEKTMSDRSSSAEQNGTGNYDSQHGPKKRDRRAFLKAGALTAMALPMGISSLSCQEEKPAAAKDVEDKGGLRYRRLGRTNLMISEISLGGSPVPPEGVFKRAVEMGVNYVDSSSTYMNGNSERIIGKMIKGRRDRFHVATKFHPGRKYKTRKGLIEEVEGSLSRLGTDYVDVLLFHGAKSPEWPLHEEVLAAFALLKKQGKIRFTGVSCHNDPAGVLLPLIASDHYDMITLGYNAFSGDLVEKDKVYQDWLKRSGIEKVIALAREKDLGVIAMKTMAGGARQDLAAFKKEGVSLPQAKLKWVLQNESISGLITEMGSFEMLEENLAVSGKPMTGQEKKVLKKAVRAAWCDHCRMCGTCTKTCPSRIPIPDIFRMVAYHDGYGKQDFARHAYQKLVRSDRPEPCQGCRRCEQACPGGLSIRRKLKNATRLLG